MTTHCINKSVDAQAVISTFMLPFVGSEFGATAKTKTALTNATRIFSANLNTLVDFHDLTPNAAARKCKLSWPQMDRLLRCDHSPTLDTLHRIATGFGIDVYQLLIPGLQPENLAQAVTQKMVARWRRIEAEIVGLEAEDAGEGKARVADGSAANRAGQGPGTHRASQQDPSRTTKRAAPRSKASKKHP